MNSKEFYKIIDVFIDSVMKTLNSKNDEYTGDNDRLSNFRRAAGLSGTTMEQACFGMMAKHIVSVAELSQRENVDKDMWNEKLTDLINYCLLMWAIVNENID